MLWIILQHLNLRTIQALVSFQTSEGCVKSSMLRLETMVGTCCHLVKRVWIWRSCENTVFVFLLFSHLANTLFSWNSHMWLVMYLSLYLCCLKISIRWQKLIYCINVGFRILCDIVISAIFSRRYTASQNFQYGPGLIWNINYKKCNI